MLLLLYGATTYGAARYLPLAEHRYVETGDQLAKGLLAAKHSPRLIVATEGGERVFVEIPRAEGIHLHRIGPHAASNQSCPASLFRIEFPISSPRFEAHADLSGARLVLRRSHDTTVRIEREPLATRRVDVIVHVEGQ